MAKLFEKLFPGLFFQPASTGYGVKKSKEGKVGGDKRRSQSPYFACYPDLHNNERRKREGLGR